MRGLSVPGGWAGAREHTRLLCMERSANNNNRGVCWRQGLPVHSSPLQLVAREVPELPGQGKDPLFNGSFPALPARGWDCDGARRCGEPCRVLSARRRTGNSDWRMARWEFSQKRRWSFWDRSLLVLSLPLNGGLGAPALPSEA